MTSSATSRLRIDFHRIKVDFKKKSEVFNPYNKPCKLLLLLLYFILKLLMLATSALRDYVYSISI